MIAPRGGCRRREAYLHDVGGYRAAGVAVATLRRVGEEEEQDRRDHRPLVSSWIVLHHPCHWLHHLPHLLSCVFSPCNPCRHALSRDHDGYDDFHRYDGVHRLFLDASLFPSRVRGLCRTPYPCVVVLGTYLDGLCCDSPFAYHRSSPAHDVSRVYLCPFLCREGSENE